MAIDFRWITKQTGRRIAKVNVTFAIERQDLVKGTKAALSDALGTEKETAERYREEAAKMTKAKAEAGLRSMLSAYGGIWMESSDDYITIDWELDELVGELAEEVVSRLWPELEINPR